MSLSRKKIENQSSPPNKNNNNNNNIDCSMVWASPQTKTGRILFPSIILFEK